MTCDYFARWQHRSAIPPLPDYSRLLLLLLLLLRECSSSQTEVDGDGDHVLGTERWNSQRCGWRNVYIHHRHRTFRVQGHRGHSRGWRRFDGLVRARSFRHSGRSCCCRLFLQSGIRPTASHDLQHSDVALARRRVIHSVLIRWRRTAPSFAEIKTNAKATCAHPHKIWVHRGP